MHSQVKKAPLNPFPPNHINLRTLTKLQTRINKELESKTSTKEDSCEIRVNKSPDSSLTNQHLLLYPELDFKFCISGPTKVLNQMPGYQEHIDEILNGAEHIIECIDTTAVTKTTESEKEALFKVRAPLFVPPPPFIMQVPSATTNSGNLIKTTTTSLINGLPLLPHQQGHSLSFLPSPPSSIPHHLLSPFTNLKSSSNSTSAGTINSTFPSLLPSMVFAPPHKALSSSFPLPYSASNYYILPTSFPVASPWDIPSTPPHLNSLQQLFARAGILKSAPVFTANSVTSSNGVVTSSNGAVTSSNGAVTNGNGSVSSPAQQQITIPQALTSMFPPVSSLSAAINMPVILEHSTSSDKDIRCFVKNAIHSTEEIDVDTGTRVPDSMQDEDKLEQDSDEPDSITGRQDSGVRSSKYSGDRPGGDRPGAGAGGPGIGSKREGGGRNISSTAVAHQSMKRKLTFSSPDTTKILKLSTDASIVTSGLSCTTRSREVVSNSKLSTGSMVALQPSIPLSSAERELNEGGKGIVDHQSPDSELQEMETAPSPSQNLNNNNSKCLIIILITSIYVELFLRDVSCYLYGGYSCISYPSRPH